MADPADARARYARRLAVAAAAANPRIERAFATVPREAFLGPGPWQIVAEGRLVETPDADASHIYENVLVVLDPDKGINNGEPLLHAMWMARVAPQLGETVLHIGAGTGYYTALLSLLVQPGGLVVAFELDPGLAARATENLRPYGNVGLVHANALTSVVPPANVIYVNAAVAAPPQAWLQPLLPGGRLIFPWQPTRRLGITILITRRGQGFACDPLMGSRFIACSGLAEAGTAVEVTREQALRSRSLWLVADRRPDSSSTAIFDEVWFSSRRLPDAPPP
ncbi:SAM-dependent methyltransferase [Mesorhizobium sp. Root157]|uniref:protein-L-isoaspartate O-methyltransferase family protein n=1 Tax=Mesorhizobium sp. Root157 TaxID=1736477 RepID=UPI0006F5340C|nr:rRNA adenine N-6-methyltransferase family protein [Mesorhizobium sp. Root157]KQZ87164.1 SAM-dependent methyltransferase [Mesorhizobium sp. Root157]